MGPRNVRIVMTSLLLVGALACRTDEVLFAEPPPAEELWAEAEETLEGTSVLWVYRFVNYEKAIETLQSIVDNYPYSQYAVEAELRIADAYFEDLKYEEALSYYRDFADLHPEHAQVPYTVWRAALCHERRSLDPGRDQTATREAMVFLDRLLLNHPRSEYSEPAEKMWRDLQTRLAEHDEGIADFYFERGEFEAAAERYRALLNDHPGLGLDARMLFRLGECYAALQRTDESDRIFRTLVAHYSESEYGHRARQKLAVNLP